MPDHAAIHQLHRSCARIAQACESDRQELERRLHNDVQQRLVALRIGLRLASERTAADAAAPDELEALGREVDAAIGALRDVAHELFPCVLHHHGLVPALESVGRAAAMPVTVRARDIGRHAIGTEAAIYRCCSEAIAHAAAHSGAASRIRLTLRVEEGRLHFEVAHDGPGCDRPASHLGPWLQRMRDRFGVLGGHFAIANHPGMGTIVSGFAPVTA